MWDVIRVVGSSRDGFYGYRFSLAAGCAEKGERQQLVVDAKGGNPVFKFRDGKG